MDPKLPDPSEYIPLTGSLIPITMKPRQISANGDFLIVMNAGQNQSNGSNILTLVALGTESISGSFLSLKLNGHEVSLVKDFAIAIELLFTQTRTATLEGQVAKDQSVEISIISGAGRASVTVHGEEN